MKGSITPNLWFDTEAEEAAEFYVSVFENSRIVNVTHYTEAGPREAGMVMTVEFELDGQRFVGINGGPEFTFDEAVSFEIDCETQEEVDYYWERLTDGGEEGPCGWLKDRFGLSWQVVPTGMDELFADPDPERARARDGGDAEDAQARHRRAAGGRRRRELARVTRAAIGVQLGHAGAQGVSCSARGGVVPRAGGRSRCETAGVGLQRPRRQPVVPARSPGRATSTPASRTGSRHATS